MSKRTRRQKAEASARRKAQREADRIAEVNHRYQRIWRNGGRS